MTTAFGDVCFRGNSGHWGMSALPPKVDIRCRDRDVHFVPKADSCTAAKRYSISSLAVASSCGSILRPSDLAVLRLTTKMNYRHRRLLCACRKRPCGRRACNYLHEIASSHRLPQGLGPRQSHRRLQQGFVTGGMGFRGQFARHQS